MAQLKNCGSSPPKLAPPSKLAFLLIEPSDALKPDLDDLSRDLQRTGATVEVSTAGSRNISDILVVRVPDVCVVDPGEKRVDALVSQVRDRFPATRVIVISLAPTLAGAFNAGRSGAVAYLPRPVVANSILCTAAGQDCLQWMDSEVPELPSPRSYERQYIEWVMTACGGNKSEAARRLRIRRSVLQRKLSKRSTR